MLGWLKSTKRKQKNVNYMRDTAHLSLKVQRYPHRHSELWHVPTYRAMYGGHGLANTLPPLLSKFHAKNTDVTSMP